MFPGLSPKKMQSIMRQMGMSQEEIEAVRVIIEKSDNSRLIIDNPSVVKIKMQGQENFQISGDVSEEESFEESISEEDIKMVMEKTGADEEKVREVLEETRDLAETILKLSE